MLYIDIENNEDIFGHDGKSTSPAQTNQTAKGLVQGTYSCLITDANGCTFTDSVVVNFVVGIKDLIQEYKISLVTMKE